jgi:hypothetical protein
MAVVEVHPVPIAGPWIEGFVLDRHVNLQRADWLSRRAPAVRDNPLRLGRTGVSAEVLKRTAERHRRHRRAFVNERWNGGIDCVVSPPPSLHRTKQPAVLIAAGMAAALGVPTAPAASVKATATPQMKNVPLHEAPLCYLRLFRQGPMLPRGGGFCLSTTCGKLLVR